MSSHGFVCYPPFTVDPCENIKVNRYKSSKTGLTVIHADIEGPLVSGFLALATKVDNDNGCPHTLEHLVFLGSEKYPYRGTLDLLAPRAYTSGTNAWTDIDHTCYTLTTAGSDGFLQLLPVYVDHILYPTLTDSAFCTEIHHINQNGEDAGVVYCELQARENSMSDIMQRKLQRLIYPIQSGYRYEAGGLMGCIRQLKIESIREYHQQYYHPDNLVIVIMGQLNQECLLSTLEQIDVPVLDSSYTDRPKPWNPIPYVPDLKRNQIEIIHFPGEPESLGEIIVTWLGPKWNEFLEIQAIYMINIYLADSPIAPLKELFVECSQPYCSELDFKTMERSRITISLTFRNVRLDKADDVVPLLVATLNDIVSKAQFDMKRMMALIQKEKLKFLDDYETRAAFILALPIITASIYGDLESEDFVNALQQAKYLDILMNFSKNDWLDLLSRVYIKTAYTALIGKPSSGVSQDLAQVEKNRIKHQQDKFGKGGLKALGERLKEAIKINEAQIPARIMENFPIPNVASISSIDVLTAINPDRSIHNNLVQSFINQDTSEIPYSIQYDHISSAFVSVSVYMNTSTLPSHLRPYGRIYMDIIFSSPLLIDDQHYIDHHKVIQQLDHDLISYNATLGYHAEFREYIVINIKLEAKKFEMGIKWLHHLMCDIQFTSERLMVGVNKTLDDIPRAKRNGKLVADWTIRAIHTNIEKSTEAACSYLYQDHFLPKVLSKLKNNPDQVIQDMYEFKSILCQGQNLRVHVIGDILKLEKPKSVFKYWRQKKKINTLSPIMYAKDVLGNYGKYPGHCTAVVVLPYTESSFSVHSTNGPSDFDSLEIPPLLILMEMLHAMEGTYTRLIRGLGLAYKCWLSHRPEAGHLSLHILQSSDILSAFDQMKQVSTCLARGDIAFETYALEGAKSSVIFDLADREGTREVAAAQSFIKQLRQTKQEKMDFLKAVQNVTMNDVYKTLKRYVLPLFDTKKSNHVIVSSEEKSVDIAQTLKKMGHPVKVIKMEDVYTNNLF